MRFLTSLECSTLLGMQVYNLFGLLWTSNYVLALGQCSLAGAFASYYWAPPPGGPKVHFFHHYYCI